MLNDFQVYVMAKEYYDLCRRQRLPYFLRDHIMRASSSVALNIAEGSGKPSKKEQSRFYGIALGSLRECQAILDIENIQNEKLNVLGNSLGAMLYTLARLKTENPNRN